MHSSSNCTIGWPKAIASQAFATKIAKFAILVCHANLRSVEKPNFSNLKNVEAGLRDFNVEPAEILNWYEINNLISGPAKLARFYTQ